MSYNSSLTDAQLRAIPLSISGSLTDAQLRATPAPVAASQSGTWNINSITTLPALATGANVIGAVTQSGTWNIGAVTSLPGVADITTSGTLAALNATVALTITSGYSSGVVQITGTWVGTITFEGTADGTNWVSINAVVAGTSTPGPTTTTNGIVRLTPAGLTQFRVNMSAYTSGTATITLRASQGTGGTFLNQSLTAGSNIIGKMGIDQTTPGTTNLVSIGTNGTVALNAAIPTGANVIGALTANQSVNNAQIAGVATATGNGVVGTGVQRVAIASDNAPFSVNATTTASAAAATYSAAIVALAPAALATDVFTITGSATKTVRVSRILVNGVQTTASQVNIVIIKRSTANTAGTSTAQTRVPYDSTSAAATATVLAYTANPTTGTLVGRISARRLFIPGAATASDAQGLEIVSGDVGQQLLTARGINEVIAISLEGTTLTGGALNITIEWMES